MPGRAARRLKYFDREMLRRSSPHALAIHVEKGPAIAPTFFMPQISGNYRRGLLFCRSTDDRTNKTDRRACGLSTLAPLCKTSGCRAFFSNDSVGVGTSVVRRPRHFITVHGAGYKFMP
jgi:hypothetical protein